MKVVVTGLIAISAALVASGVSAAGTVVSGGVIAQSSCDLISEDVSVSLSTGVVGAYDCNPDTDAIKVATCHQNGQRASRKITCVKVGEQDDANSTPIYNVSSCTAAGAEVDVTNSYAGYVASTAGGSLGTTNLGGACDENGTALTNLPFFAE